MRDDLPELKERTWPCPKCRKRLMRMPLALNALSRRDNETYICSECGDAEALHDDDIARLREYYFKHSEFDKLDALQKIVSREQLWLYTDHARVCREKFQPMAREQEKREQEREEK